MALFKTVAEAISKNTFDYLEADGGWPDISWLIANHLLNDYDEFSRHKLIDSMVGQIKQCLPRAIDYSEHDLNVKIYRGYTLEGTGRKLAFITPDPAYKDSKDKDYARIMKSLEKYCRNDKEAPAAGLKTAHSPGTGHTQSSRTNLFDKGNLYESGN